MKFLSFLCTKWMENCEAMTSSPHSFAYSYRLFKKCFLKICKTSKCHNFLIFQPIFIRFSLLCLKFFTLSSEIKLNLLWSSSLNEFNQWIHYFYPDFFENGFINKSINEWRMNLKKSEWKSMNEQINKLNVWMLDESQKLYHKMNSDSINTCVMWLIIWRKSYSSWIWLTAASTNPINM